MRWIRQNIRGGVRLALFALAVHMALSFGHVHADLLSSLSAAAADSADIHAPDQPSPPSHPYRSSGANDFCAVCANIGVLGSLILPAPSGLVMPRPFGRVRFALVPATVRFVQPRSFSQARGPPSA